jgi:O-antigen ligase
MIELRDFIRRMALWQKLLAGFVIVAVCALVSRALTGSPGIGAVLALIVLVAINPPRPGRSPNRER